MALTKGVLTKQRNHARNRDTIGIRAALRDPRMETANLEPAEIRSHLLEEFDK
jgi:hypothetical protein